MLKQLLKLNKDKIRLQILLKKNLQKNNYQELNNNYIQKIMQKLQKVFKILNFKGIDLGKKRLLKKDKN